MIDHHRDRGSPTYIAALSADHHAEDKEGVHNQQNHHDGDHEPFLAIPSAQCSPSSPYAGITDDPA